VDQLVLKFLHILVLSEGKKGNGDAVGAHHPGISSVMIDVSGNIPYDPDSVLDLLSRFS
jgi:hypothetical protein